MASNIRTTFLACLQAYKQWGYAGSNGGSVDVTFPISFTKIVYQIQLTNNNSSYENPTYAIKDTKSFSYWCKYGGDKLWLAIGAQQWGYANNSASGVTTINYHIPYSLVAMTYTTNHTSANSYSAVNINNCTLKSFDVHARAYNNGNLIFTNDAFNWLSIGKQQWGIATQAGYATAYPITFPSRCLAVVATYVLRDASSYWQKPLSLQAITRSSFTAATASSWGANDTALWIAVGM